MSSIIIAGETSGSVELKTQEVAGNVVLEFPSKSGTILQSNDQTSFRNKIIGGDFTTNPWQRGTSFAAPTAVYTADRFFAANTTTGVVNILKTADAPTATQAGVYTQHCLHVDVTTADTAMAAGEYANVYQRVEGLNAASFGFGQAGTRYVTLSFWHKHTKTGTYCVAFRNGTDTRSYVAEYTQDVTDTWEKATITITVDTTGTWLYDTGAGIELRFSICSGSTFQTTGNTWTVGNFLATANQVNALDNTANNFKIALVQLEAGDTATTFETRMVGQELSLCQRYYEVLYACGIIGSASSAGGLVGNFIGFATSKRAVPTLTEGAPSENVNVSSVSLSPVNINGFRFYANTTAAGNAYRTSNVVVSAEL